MINIEEDRNHQVSVSFQISRSILSLTSNPNYFSFPYVLYQGKNIHQKKVPMFTEYILIRCKNNNVKCPYGELSIRQENLSLGEIHIHKFVHC